MDSARRFTAQVRADGSLVSDDATTGSIHTLGAKLQSAASCNGWAFWYLERDGQSVPIDDLRAKLRAEMGDVPPAGQA